MMTVLPLSRNDNKASISSYSILFIYYIKNLIDYFYKKVEYIDSQFFIKYLSFKIGAWGLLLVLVLMVK